MHPAPELEALRDHHWRWKDITLTPASVHGLNEIRGNCLEIVAEIEPGDAEKVALWTHCDPEGEERTLIAYDFAEGCLVVDRRQSSLSRLVDCDVQAAPLALPMGEPLRLHIFIDGSVIEIFAGSHTCLTSRVYPTRPDSSGLELVTFGGTARLKSLDIWTLKSIDVPPEALTRLS